jgi:hypothetical protein
MRKIRAIYPSKRFVNSSSSSSRYLTLPGKNKGVSRRKKRLEDVEKLSESFLSEVSSGNLMKVSFLINTCSV